MKKIINFLAIIMSFFIFSTVSLALDSINATNISLKKVTASTIIDSDYNFSPRFISGKTTYTTSGMTNYSVDSKTSNNSAPIRAVSARLTSNNQKEKVWIRYNNVGTYKNEIIDMQITLSDWEYLQPANKSADSSIGGVNYTTIFFRTDSIGVSMTANPGISQPSFTYTFYKHGTNTPVSVKGHMTFNDIDGDAGGTGVNEFIIPKSGFNVYYVSNDTYLSVNSGKIINNTSHSTANDDKQGWLTTTFSGSSLQFVYSRLKDVKGNSFRDITKTASATNRSCYQYLINSYSIAPFNFDNPSKVVSSSKVFEEEQYTYTISQYVSENYYANTQGNKTTYTITDTLNSNVYIPDVSKIKIVDDSNSNVTSKFAISYKDNILTVTPKSNFLSEKAAYGNTFDITFPVKVKGDSKKVNITNEAVTKSTVNGVASTLSSNTVNTNLKYMVNLTTDATHCKIDKEQSIIVDAGENNSFLVTITPDYGYELKDIGIDGKSVKNLESFKMNVDGSCSFLIENQNILSNISHKVVASAIPISRNIKVTKTWEDFENKYNKRPENIRIELLKDGIKINEYTLNVKNGETSYSFNNLPKYDLENKKEINYTVREMKIKENDLYFYNCDVLGNMDEGFKIINSFRFDEPKVNAFINKTSAKEINNSYECVDYNISYTAELDNVLGKASVIIVDSLPYQLDTTKSDFAGGIYNEEEKTITWKEDICGIDTYEERKKEINISKKIKLVYKNIDLTKDNMKNTVEGKIIIDTTNATNTVKGDAITKINVDGNLIVSHYDINSREKIIEDEEYTDKFGQVYSTSPNTDLLKSYTLMQIEGKEIDKYIEGTIKVSYYYAKKSDLIVNYIDRITGETLDTYTEGGYEGKEYKTFTKDFEKYTLIEIPDNATGTMQREGTSVNYYYLYNSEIDIKYIDKYTNEILDKDSIKGLEGDNVSTSLKEIKGYTIVEMPATEKYIITKEKQHVNYYYAKDTDLIVNYIDKSSNEVLDSYTEKGYEGKEFETLPKDFEKYTLIQIPDNAKEKMKRDGNIVNYYYLYNSEIIINYIDKITNKVLDKDNIEGLEGDNIRTVAKDLENYTLVEKPIEEEYILSKKVSIVNYYYQYNSNLVTNYIDKYANKILEHIPSKGLEGDKVVTKAKQIKGYTLIEGPAKEEYLLSKEQQYINYYYAKDTKILVKYIDKDTGEVLEKYTENGYEGKDYITNSKKIKGYRLVKVPINASGKMKSDIIEINYYYERPKEAKILPRTGESQDICNEIIFVIANLILAMILIKNLNFLL